MLKNVSNSADSTRRLGVSVLLVLASLSCQPNGEGVRAETSGNRIASISYGNLYEHEEYWPYRVQLVEEWKPEGWEGRFGWGVGILVRVESSGSLRIDFAGLGKFLVPADVTNVLGEANRIRVGSLSKPSSNFVLAVGTRLLDLASDPIRPVSKGRMDAAKGFLIVFADPVSDTFQTIASRISALDSQYGVVAMLFPQGSHRDGTSLNACKRADWTQLVLFDRFTDALTESYLGEMPKEPHVMLISPEGRLILSRGWKEGIDETLKAAMAEAWPAE